MFAVSILTNNGQEIVAFTKTLERFENDEKCVELLYPCVVEQERIYYSDDDSDDVSEGNVKTKEIYRLKKLQNSSGRCVILKNSSITSFSTMSVDAIEIYMQSIDQLYDIDDQDVFLYDVEEQIKVYQDQQRIMSQNEKYLTRMNALKQDS